MDVRIFHPILLNTPLQKFDTNLGSLSETIACGIDQSYSLRGLSQNGTHTCAIHCFPGFYLRALTLRTRKPTDHVPRYKPDHGCSLFRSSSSRTASISSRVVISSCCMTTNLPSFEDLSAGQVFSSFKVTVQTPTSFQS